MGNTRLYASLDSFSDTWSLTTWTGTTSGSLGGGKTVYTAFGGRRGSHCRGNPMGRGYILLAVRVLGGFPGSRGVEVSWSLLSRLSCANFRVSFPINGQSIMKCDGSKQR
jgi:hypothetical protein